jgi:hypothetical protein
VTAALILASIALISAAVTTRAGAPELTEDRKRSRRKQIKQQRGAPAVAGGGSHGDRLHHALSNVTRDDLAGDVPERIARPPTTGIAALPFLERSPDGALALAHCCSGAAYQRRLLLTKLTIGQDAPAGRVVSRDTVCSDRSCDTASRP